jgi:hypothetical protein
MALILAQSPCLGGIHNNVGARQPVSLLPLVRTHLSALPRFRSTSR